jgi:hypothetical protein
MVDTAPAADVRYPSASAQLAGVEMLHEYLLFLYTTAKSLKPDCLVIGQSPNAYFASADRLVAWASSGSLLELGIGTGRVALPIARSGVEVHGIDISPAMLAKLGAKPGADAVRTWTARHSPRLGRSNQHILCYGPDMRADIEGTGSGRADRRMPRPFQFVMCARSRSPGRSPHRRSRLVQARSDVPRQHAKSSDPVDRNRPPDPGSETAAGDPRRHAPPARSAFGHLLQVLPDASSPGPVDLRTMASAWAQRAADAHARDRLPAGAPLNAGTTE